MSRAEPKRVLPVSIPTIGLILFILVVSGFLWMQASRFVFPWPSRALRIWMLDVGQGDAFLIEFPTGERWLMDGGPDDTVLAKLGSLLPPWDRTLDAILLTHPDADHAIGLVSVLDRYQVGAIYETGILAHTAHAQAFANRVDREGASHFLLQTGDSIVIGNVQLQILWPDNPPVGTYPEKRNNFSVNVLLTYGQTSVLFTGDAEAMVEAAVGLRVGDIDVLKVGHHGSLSSTSWEFLQAVTPESAFISMGRDNSYGHPHPIVLTRLQEIGADIYRTDTDGDTLLVSSGDEPMIEPSALPF